MSIDKPNPLLKSWVLQLPGLGPAAVVASRKLKLLKRILRARLFTEQNIVLPDPETVYWINPSRIKLHTNFKKTSKNRSPEDLVFDLIGDKGKVYGGNWDISQFKFHDLAIFRALEDVILRDESWKNTKFYRSLLNGPNEQRTQWGIDDKATLDARCRDIDELIDSMKSGGFEEAHGKRRPGKEYGVGNHKNYGHEITVNIGRDGQYMFQGGSLRLAIGQILKLDTIPVKVVVRHKRWVEFRSFLQSLATDAGGSGGHAKLYQQPVHPDLSDIPVMHECVDRYDAIRENLDDSRGYMLEIGANLAYFCHRFEDLGYQCIAVEYLPQNSLAAQRIRDAEEKKFRIISMDLFDAMERHNLNEIQFDAILALNIFHHFLKYPDTYQKLCAWLGRIQVSQLFFETHCPNEEQMKGAFINYNEAEFTDFIIKNSQLNHSRLIYRCDDGRALFKLWR